MTEDEAYQQYPAELPVAGADPAGESAGASRASGAGRALLVTNFVFWFPKHGNILCFYTVY